MKWFTYPYRYILDVAFLAVITTVLLALLG